MYDKWFIVFGVYIYTLDEYIFNTHHELRHYHMTSLRAILTTQTHVIVRSIPLENV